MTAAGQARPSLRAVLVFMVAGVAWAAPLGFWQDDARLLLAGAERLAAGDAAEAIPILEFAARRAPKSALVEAWLAHAYHLERRLDEAARHYARVCVLAPEVPPDAERTTAILRHAPRVFQVASDPFGLRDAVAIHHPTEPRIAYHFFWDDDIDFPADNDPCDHELVWVTYDPTTGAVTRFETYFHGRILAAARAVEDAARHGGRPAVYVQWGKHGSLPEGWQDLRIRPNSGDIERRYLDAERAQTVADYNRAAWEKLRHEGRQDTSHPRTRGWPVRFEGTYEEFTRFDREVPYAERLRAERNLGVGAWNNALLQQRFLSYNFRPKTEWPDRAAAPSSLAAELERRVGAAGEGIMASPEAEALRRAAGRTPDPFLERLVSAPARLAGELPPADLFHPEVPRFPNLWFSAPVSRFPGYAAFLEFLERELRAAGLEATEVALNEGADVELSLEHLEPWGEVPGLAHAHALHIRLFWRRLERAGAHRVGERWRIAASAHYEVEHASPLHADVRSCPRCGRTGGYAEAGHLVEAVHDPLGVELLLFGTLRGDAVAGWRGRPFRGTEPTVVRPYRSDMNTAVVAEVRFGTR